MLWGCLWAWGLKPGSLFLAPQDTPGVEASVPLPRGGHDLVCCRLASLLLSGLQPLGTQPGAGPLTGQLSMASAHTLPLPLAVQKRVCTSC